MTQHIELSANTCLFEVDAESGVPLLLWVSTCPRVDCECRRATVVAARERDELSKGLEALDSALRATPTGGQASATPTEGVVSFEIDIDSAFPMTLNSAEGDAPLSEPRVLQVVERLGGELLDQFGVLWRRGKGYADPEAEPMRGASLPGWQPGELVAWQDAYESLRRDIYLHGASVFEAEEWYCIQTDCDCYEVTVEFNEISEPGELPACVVVISADGAARISECPFGKPLAESLWSCFRLRHPRYRERFASRYPKMRAYGERVLAHYAAKHKPKAWVPRSKKKRR